MHSYLLTFIIFSPLVGVLLLILLQKSSAQVHRIVGLLTSLVTFVLSIPLFFGFQVGTDPMQFTQQVPWISQWGINYFVGIDGISLFLILLTTFITPIILLSAWNAIKEHVSGFIISLLVMETGILGVFSALDLFLFYIFWEAMLVPMYFLIGIWGGKRRIYATMKFVIYTMVGSLLMLVAVLGIYFYGKSVLDHPTMNLLTLYTLDIPRNMQTWLFLAFGLSFAIKVPLFPFHTWLPDAHVEAPTAGSVILAGVLLKMGGYGFLRYCLPLFPDATIKFIPLIAVLAIIGIIYGALVAMVQPDLKKLVAYSSVSHLGFVVLGIFALNPQGLSGGVIQMVNHGLSTGALFLIVGMIYERRHTRMIEDFGGLAKVLPVFATFFMIVTLSSIGLPGLNGFVGEFLILLGAFQANIWYGVFAASGVILAAVYMLWMFQRVMFGPVKHEENKLLKDLSVREIVVMVPLILFIVGIGVYPKPMLDRIEPAIQNVMRKVPVEISNQSSKDADSFLGLIEDGTKNNVD